MVKFSRSRFESNIKFDRYLYGNGYRKKWLYETSEHHDKYRHGKTDCIYQ